MVNHVTQLTDKLGVVGTSGASTNCLKYLYGINVPFGEISSSRACARELLNYEGKRWNTDPDMPLDRMRTGYYAFGANQLHIIEALEKIIDFLEANHGLTASPEKEPTND